MTKNSVNVDIGLERGSDNAIGSQFTLAMHEGFDDGLEDAGDSMLDSGKERAREIVMGADRVWNKKVKNGFTTESSELQQRWYHFEGQISNSAPHAEIVDIGLAPAGEITGSNPSVQDILPWVSDNVTPGPAARAKAERANEQRWKANLGDLAEEYGTATVITAFAIRESLEEEGYPGIQFTDTTEKYLRGSFRRTIKIKVEKHIRRELKKKGFS